MAAGDIIGNVGCLYGSNWIDTFSGDINDNCFYGLNGNDIITGLDGNILILW